MQVYEAGSNTVSLSDKGEFFFSNDEVELKYYLWAHHGVMSFSIYNKSDKPIFVDWGQSSFILNDASYDYWDEIIRSKTQGSLISTYNSYWGVGFGSISSSTTLVKVKRVIQIPPKSYKAFPGFKLEMPVVEIPTKTPLFKKGRTFSESYSQSASPLTFRNYLAYGYTESMSKPKRIDNAFFIKTTTIMGPSTYRMKYGKNGKVIKNNKFYAFCQDKTANANLVGAGLGVAGCCGGAIGVLGFIALLLDLTE